MRKKGTRYTKIEKLPSKAQPVSDYAEAKGIRVGTVYMQFKRFSEGYTTNAGTVSKGSDPGFEIRCFKGTNYVIPYK